MKTLNGFKIGQRVAYDYTNPMGIKIGTIQDFSCDYRVKVKFDLGYSRWVSIINLKKVIKMIPRYLRIYDNGGETYDRYTILFTKRRIDGHFMCLGASHDLVVGSHFDTPEILDYPVSSHLGKRIEFQQLPEKVRNLVLEDYKDIWGITDKNPKLNLFL